MKRPSTNIPRSLAGQRPGGRSPEQVSVIEVSGTRKPPSMIVPGSGGVESPGGRTHERSASRYVGPMRRRGG